MVILVYTIYRSIYRILMQDDEISLITPSLSVSMYAVGFITESSVNKPIAS